MEKRQRTVFRCHGLVNLFFLFLLLLPVRYAFALEIPQFLEAEWKDTILENQRFTLKIITPFGGKESVSVVDPAWPKGIQKVSGPYTAQRTIQKEDGSFGTVLQVIYTLRSLGAGIYTVPPVTVIPRQGTSAPAPQPLSSSELYIPVLQSDERHLKYPLILEWEFLPEEIYAGQSVPLVLIMNNLEEIDLPESVSLSSPGGAILESVEGLGDISFTGLNKQTLFNVPMEAWMLTPSTSGNMTLPSAEVRIAGVSRSTSRKSINVRPLPDEVTSSGAVGDFSLDISLSDNSVTPGSILNLIVRIEGSGNLNFLNMPEPVFPEGMTFSVREIPSYKASPEGYMGYREKIYTIRPESLDRYEILIPTYAWLDPVTERISSYQERRLSLAVTGSLSPGEEEGGGQFTLMALSDSRAARGWTLFRTPLLYLFLLPGVLFFIAVMFLKHFRPSILAILTVSFLFLSAASEPEDRPPWIGEAGELFTSQSYAEALTLYRENRADWERNGTYLYNIGVLEYLNGEGAEGIADLRRARILLPMNNLIQETLAEMESRMKLKDQHRQNLLFHPDIIFLILILAFNSAMVSLAYSFLDRRSLPVLFFLLFLALTFGSSGELVRSSWLLNRPLAVLGQDSVVKKIPEEIGSDWLILGEGTTVEFVKEEGDYVLINTAYGLEGWVRQDRLLPLKEVRAR